MGSQAAVVLGASNVTLGWSELLNQLVRRSSGPIQLFTAHGMGRSYLKSQSGFMLWQLPGILHSELWDALPHVDQDESPKAMITDVGNDLVFGSNAREVADAVQKCVLRLQRWNADTEIVLSRPPLDSVRTLGEARFRLVRQILFPRCTLTLKDAIRETTELDVRLTELAQTYGVHCFQPEPGWYGFDPIHVKRVYRSTAFGRMMDGWCRSTAAAAPYNEPLTSRTRWARPQPARYELFGRPRVREQPCIQTADICVHAF